MSLAEKIGGGPNPRRLAMHAIWVHSDATQSPAPVSASPSLEEEYRGFIVIDGDLAHNLGHYYHMDDE
jgi:hypothetical protein